jgi:hypothetical protein
MFLWSPPPAVADVAWEELLKARHKRTDTFHVLLVPRIMNPRWRRLFHKRSDRAKPAILYSARSTGHSFT